MPLSCLQHQLTLICAVTFHTLVGSYVSVQTDACTLAGVPVQFLCAYINCPYLAEADTGFCCFACEGVHTGEWARKSSKKHYAHCRKRTPAGVCARADLIGSCAPKMPPAGESVVDVVLGDSTFALSKADSSGAMCTSTREVRCYGGGTLSVLRRRLQGMDLGGGPLRNSSKLE